jgi:hypothetical protein
MIGDTNTRYLYKHPVEFYINVFDKLNQTLYNQTSMQLLYGTRFPNSRLCAAALPLRLVSGDAVVFDIDDTVVDRNNKPIQFMLELYHNLLTIGCPVYFVTARVDKHNNLHATKDHLIQAGYPLFHGLFLMPKDVDRTNSKQVASFKTGVRRIIEYIHPIKAVIGNSWHDLIRPHELEDLLDETDSFLLIRTNGQVLMKLPKRHQPA